MTGSGETSITISDDVAEELKKRAEAKGFKSLSDYVTYILRQVLSRIKASEEQGKKSSEKKGEEEVKQKLRDLGYLD